MDKKLTKTFIDSQKERLEKDLKKILQQIEDLKKDDPFSDPDHASDNAAVDTDVREQVGHDTIEAQIKDLNRKTNDIKAALGRIEKNKYGHCEKCGKVVPLARLKLIPEAQYCVACEAKLRQ
ncbi:hypothetical protein GYA28_03125 [Candidatus Roizmanbacteria bacterium]|jgi:DnaK suppressor protein|nr:hypothetical protein [Candidatus Roizmanbacteria bacterium]